MGPLVMAGMTLLAGGAAIGMLGAASPRGGVVVNGRAMGRPMTLVLMAFCAGVTVMTVVVALLATATGPRIPSTAEAPIPALLALAGTILGLAIIRRNGEQADPGTARTAMAFVLGLGALGILLAALRLAILGEGGAAAPDLPFVAIGLVTAAVVLAMGVTAAGALGRLAEAPDATSVMAIYRTQLVVASMLEAVAVVGIAGAIVILFLP